MKAEVPRCWRAASPPNLPTHKSFPDSGRQGTRHRTGSDRPRCSGKGTKKPIWSVWCSRTTPVHFHQNLLFVGRKDRGCVRNSESKHEEDEQEPVHAEGLEPPAADTLRPEPWNAKSMRCHNMCVNPRPRVYLLSRQHPAIESNSDCATRIEFPTRTCRSLPRLRSAYAVAPPAARRVHRPSAAAGQAAGTPQRLSDSAAPAQQTAS